MARVGREPCTSSPTASEVRGIQATDAVPAEWIAPDFAGLEPAIGQKLFSDFRTIVEPGQWIIFHDRGTLSRHMRRG